MPFERGRSMIPAVLARIMHEGRRIDENGRRRPGFRGHEGHSVAFGRLDADVEGVVVRNCGASRHVRHTSRRNTPVLDRFLKNSVRRQPALAPSASAMRPQSCLNG